MAIGIRAASTLQESTSALSDTYVLPTGHTTGDLLLIVHGSRITGSIASSNYSADSGAYTEGAYVEDSVTAQTEPHGIVFYKFHDGSEADPTVTTTATPNMMIGTMTALTGVDTGTPEDAAEVDSINSGAVTEFTPTGITTVTNGAWVLSIVWGTGLTNFALKAGSEQGFTLLAGGSAFDAASGQDMGLGIAYKEIASFGGVTCPTWTCTSSEWIATTMAFRPAATGTTVTPDPIALSVTLPAASPLAASTVTPAAIALSTVHPQATPGVPATVTPDTIALSAVLPAPTITAASVVTPATIELATTHPAATAFAPGLVAPDTIALSTTHPAPTITAASVVTPDTIPLATTHPAASPLAAALVAPATIALVADLPAASAVVEGGETIVSPATIGLSVALPAASALAASTVTPATIELSTTHPAVTITAAATVTPSVIALSAALPAPSILAGANVTVDVIALAAVFPAASPLAASTVSPATIELAALLGAVTVVVETETTVFPAAIAVSVAFPAVTVEVRELPQLFDFPLRGTSRPKTRRAGPPLKLLSDRPNHPWSTRRPR